MRAFGWFLAGGLLVSVVLAAVVSNLAATSPDGLDSTMLQGCEVVDGEIVGGTCLAQQAREHELAGSPFADYGLAGVDNPALATAITGTAGVLLTFGIGAGLFWLLRRRSPAGGSGDGV